MANKEIEVRKENSPSQQNLVPEFDRMFDNMVERFFGSRFGSLLGDWPELTRRGAMTNIQETDNSYILSAEIPGVPQEDIQVNVNGNLLTVHAEHKEESGSEDSERGYRRQYRSFHQSFSLPTTIDPEKIEANYENGLLEIMMPKTEQSQAKKIEVQSGKGGFLNRLIGKGDQKKSQEKKDVKH